MLKAAIIIVVVGDGGSLKKFAVHENFDEATSVKERMAHWRCS
jgi:hypothetical protein